MPHKPRKKSLLIIYFALSILILTILTACEDRSGGIEVSQNDQWKPLIREFDGVEMVQVPRGCFMMGSDVGRRDELPVHEICFEKPYWIDRTEVTNVQYGSEGPQSGDLRPRTNITWFEARDYCASREMRLPTEAEWEYAARGPDSPIYPWGDELVNQNLVFDKNLPGDTAEVASRPAGVSWVGAMDMSGNVWEWVSSIYRPYPYSANDGREDMADTSNRRVYRSGIHTYIDYGVSAAIRFWLLPDERDWYIGFRCAKDN